MKLAIVIVSYNVGNYLKNCLDSVKKTAQNLDPEIIVVDNNSTDNSLQILAREFPEVKVIANSRNYGFAKGANLGMKKTQAEFILLLNPDTLVSECAITSMLEYMQSRPEIGILGPQLLDPDGSLQHSCRSFPSWSVYFSNRQSLLNRFFPSNRWSNQYLLKQIDHSKIQEVDWITGCCLLLRKKMLEEIDYLDEDFFMYIEDVDIAKRAKAKNWKVVYFPSAKLVHFKSKSVLQNRLRMVVEHHRSMYRYYSKYFPRNLLVRNLVFLGVFLRLGFWVLENKLKS